MDDSSVVLLFKTSTLSWRDTLTLRVRVAILTVSEEGVEDTLEIRRHIRTVFVTCAQHKKGIREQSANKRLSIVALVW